jgi:hypothetical protein
MPPKFSSLAVGESIFLSALLSLERKFVKQLATGIVALMEANYTNFCSNTRSNLVQLIMNSGSRFKVTMPESHRRRWSLRVA